MYKSKNKIDLNFYWCEIDRSNLKKWHTNYGGYSDFNLIFLYFPGKISNSNFIIKNGPIKINKI